MFANVSESELHETVLAKRKQAAETRQRLDWATENFEAARSEHATNVSLSSDLRARCQTLQDEIHVLEDEIEAAEREIGRRTEKRIELQRHMAGGEPAGGKGAGTAAGRDNDVCEPEPT